MAEHGAQYDAIGNRYEAYTRMATLKGARATRCSAWRGC